MSRRRGNRGLELGVVLLFSEILNVGVSNIPPITLITIAGQVLLYLGIINAPWEKWDVCISAEKVLTTHDYKRLIFSAFEHADDMHLYYNMISFMIKGRSLETRYGSTNYAFFLAIITLLTNFIYILLAQVGTGITDDPYYWKSCAIGFSGVIFALKVVTSYEAPHGRTLVAGISIPVQYAAWAELLLIHLLVPNASFLGHLSGILAGVVYCYTAIGSFIDSFITGITGEMQIHNSFHRRSTHYTDNENYEYYE